MIQRSVTAMLILAVLCTLTIVSLAQEEAAELPIDAKTAEVLSQMGERHRQIKHFKFRVYDTIDEVLPSGQKIQFSHIRSGLVSRPNRMRLDVYGDVTDRMIWKDDKTLTLYNEGLNVYGQIEAPGTIDETLDMMLEEYKVSIPLADLLSADMREVFMQNVVKGEYVGLHFAADIECHHLAFTQENIDWQVWIDAGDEPRLRKLVITYKLQPGEPQYTLVVDEVTVLSEAPSPEEFVFTPPEGARKIEVRKSESGKSATAEGQR